MNLFEKITITLASEDAKAVLYDGLGANVLQTYGGMGAVDDYEVDDNGQLIVTLLPLPPPPEPAASEGSA